MIENTKLDDFKTNQILFMLKTIIKWQLESIQNIKEQYFGIQASQFMTSYIHDLGMFVKTHKLDIEPEEWQKLYMKASEDARKEFLKENEETTLEKELGNNNE